MSKQVKALYEFGDFRLETSERVLRHKGKPVPLTPKAFETLLVLVERSGHLVEKDDLMKEVWADAFVEEANLARNIWTLRKALGDDEREHRYIETVPKHGYRFIAPVKEMPLEAVDVIVQRRVRARIIKEEELSDDDLSDSRKRASAGFKSSLESQPSQFLQPVAAPKANRFALLPTALTKTAVLAFLVCSVIAMAAILIFVTHNNQAGTHEKVDSIAVLPFGHSGEDTNLEYLSDGLTENVINRLSHVSSLKVIARSSVYRYKGQEIE